MVRSEQFNPQPRGAPTFPMGNPSLLPHQALFHATAPDFLGELLTSAYVRCDLRRCISSVFKGDVSNHRMSSTSRYSPCFLVSSCTHTDDSQRCVVKSTYTYTMNPLTYLKGSNRSVKVCTFIQASLRYGTLTCSPVFIDFGQWPFGSVKVLDFEPEISCFLVLCPNCAHYLFHFLHLG